MIEIKEDATQDIITMNYSNTDVDFAVNGNTVADLFKVDAGLDTVTIKNLNLGSEMDAGAHSIGFTLQSATGDGTTTIDWKLGNKFKFTFGAFNETFTFTAPSNPCSVQMIIVQDGTGSRTATWPASVKWVGGSAPTLTTTATTGTDIVSFFFDGTNYFGGASLDFS